MMVNLSYAEKIINALSRTKHTRDVIYNCKVDAEAINEVLAPLFARLDAAEAVVRMDEINAVTPSFDALPPNWYEQYDERLANWRRAAGKEGT